MPIQKFSAKRSRKYRVLAWMGAVLLWLFAILCFVLAWFVLTDMTASARIKTFLLLLFGGMGASLLWLGWRALSDEPQRLFAVRYPQQVFLEEIQQNAQACLRHPLASEYHSHVANKDWSEAEQTLVNMRLAESNAFVAAAIGDCREATGDYTGAAEMYAQAEKQISPDAAIWLKLQRVRMLLRQGNAAAATELGRSIVGPLNGAQKLAALDSLACIPIMEGFKNFLPAADEFSREAFLMQPQNLTLKGTRGSILVELGRLDEAEPLLSDVYTTSEADHDQRISAFYLGLIAKSRGDLRRARALAAESLVYSEKWLTDRTEKELLG